MMKKGKFGIVLCFYPIVGFACVILQQPFLCALLLALAIFLEKDEWAGRQTFQAWVLSLVVAFFSECVPWAVGLFSLSFITDIFSTIASVVSAIIYVGAIVFSILGILRVAKDQEANIPLASDLSYRIYGKRAPRPIPGQYPPPYGAQYPVQSPAPSQAPGNGPVNGAPQQNSVDPSGKPSA